MMVVRTESYLADFFEGKEEVEGSLWTSMAVHQDKKELKGG